jgi:hypothetical protein
MAPSIRTDRAFDPFGLLPVHYPISGGAACREERQ